MENCSIFVEACKLCGMELVNVGPSGELCRAVAPILLWGVFHAVAAADIVDGNEKIVLGLVWRLILTFGINEVSDSGKAGLLEWAKTTTEGYPGVRISNFTSSWESGEGSACATTVKILSLALFRVVPRCYVCALRPCLRPCILRIGRCLGQAALCRDAR